MTGLIRRILVVSLIIIPIPSYATAKKPVISYDKSTDTITANIDDASFTQVMSRIAVLSGIEIRMDPTAEHDISISLTEMPLEKALRQIAGNASYVFIYDDPKPERDKDQATSRKPVLVGMQILPKGESSSNMMRPLLAPIGEAFIREKNRYAAPEHKLVIFNHAQERWAARLKMMPPEQRKQLLAAAQEQRQQIEQRNTKRQQRQEQLAQRRKQHQQQHEAKLLQLKATNPEAYQRMMQAREEIRLGFYPPTR